MTIANFSTTILRPVLQLAARPLFRGSRATRLESTIARSGLSFGLRVFIFGERALRGGAPRGLMVRGGERMKA